MVWKTTGIRDILVMGQLLYWPSAGRHMKLIYSFKQITLSEEEVRGVAGAGG